MILKSIHDLPLAHPNQEGDEGFLLGIFAAGFEKRSWALAQLLNMDRFKKNVVLKFKEFDNAGARESADEFYESLPNCTPYECGTYSEDDIYAVLRECVPSGTGVDAIKIMVDYSSMPRIWYAAILNYFKMVNPQCRVELYFGYLAGIYVGQITPKSVERITVVPGFEGVAGAAGRSLAVFGLGFEPWSVYAVLERIDSDEIIALIADPGSEPKAAGLSREINNEFIEAYSDELLPLPLFEVSTVFRILAERITFNLAQSDDVTLVGLGPKPHVLAMLLLGIRFPEVAIVQAKAQHNAPDDIDSMDVGCFTRVEFVPELL